MTTYKDLRPPWMPSSIGFDDEDTDVSELLAEDTIVERAHVCSAECSVLPELPSLFGKNE